MNFHVGKGGLCSLKGFAVRASRSEVNMVCKVALTGPLDWPDEADEGALEAQDGPDAVSATTATPSSPPPVPWQDHACRAGQRIVRATSGAYCRLPAGARGRTMHV